MQEAVDIQIRTIKTVPAIWAGDFAVPFLQFIPAAVADVFMRGCLKSFLFRSRFGRVHDAHRPRVYYGRFCQIPKNTLLEKGRKGRGQNGKMAL